MRQAKAKMARAPAATGTSRTSPARADHIRLAGELLLRYGVVLILFWIGAMKFTAYEAAAIQPLVASSPFMSWIYNLFSVQAVSNLLGTVEIIIALLIGLRPLSPFLTAVGSALAVPMFLTTFSFLFSLPGWELALGGFPALSSAGGFLVKDIVLLGAVLWSLGEALVAMRVEASERAPLTRTAKPVMGS